MTRGRYTLVRIICVPLIRDFGFFLHYHDIIVIATRRQETNALSLSSSSWLLYLRCMLSGDSAACAAMRQTWEEIGLDLAEPEYTCIGQLDDREITTSLGKRLLMILSPFGELHQKLLITAPSNLITVGFSNSIPTLITLRTNT